MFYILILAYTLYFFTFFIIGGDFMLKKLAFIITIISLLIITGCSKEEKTNPRDIVDVYIERWENHQFEAMYAMLTEETKETYDTSDYIERYEKIYNDLKINNLTVSVIDNGTEEDENTAVFPINVSMNSIAGPIKFSTKLHLEVAFDESEEKDKWFVNW